MSLKILLLSHKFNPDIGGIEVNSEIYAHAFAAAGHEVRLLTWSAQNAETTFPFAVIRNPSKWTLVKEHAWADIVFENNPCMRLGWPALFFGRPCVVSLNTELSNSSGVDWLKHAWLKRADSVICVSEAVRKKCWPTAAVIGNPYRANTFRRLPEVARTDDFVFLGRLVSQKGTKLAVLAFQQLLARLAENKSPLKRPKLTIIGDGPERASLVQLVAALELTEYVRFTGFLQGEALVRQLNAHRFMLVPSLYEEAFGNVVLEGMACGCLPLVSDSGGLPAAAGPAGLVFSRGSVEALVASTWEILHAPLHEAQLRQAAPAHLALHTPELVSQRYLQVLATAAKVAEQRAVAATPPPAKPKELA